MKKMILYVGNFVYPNGNAAGKRVLGNVKAIKGVGYSTAVFCFRNTNEGSYLQKDTIEDTLMYTIPYSDGLPRLNNHKVFSRFRDVLTQLKSQYQIAGVIMYTTLGTVDFNVKVIKTCHKNNIKVYYDFCDYFSDISKNNFLKYLIKKSDLNLLNTSVLPNCDGIITISSYLKDKTNRKDVCVTVPPLSAEDDIQQVKNDNVSPVISYASFLSDTNRPVCEWKDRIDVILDVFVYIKKQYPEIKFLLKFIGFSEENLLNMFLVHERSAYRDKIEFLSDHVVFLGKCDNYKAQSEIMNSDFTILIRDSKESTNAGFPTKVSESISLGIPVIVNLTSDLKQYIEDEKNGFIVSNPDNVREIGEQVKEIISMDNMRINEMKEYTLRTNPFHYSKYVTVFEDYFNKMEMK
ncbi:MAG: glycosyltransferase [Lachnospiraceae bacterium]|nr:glycosyltransferase [Lachnospiraceae bacterium]